MSKVDTSSECSNKEKKLSLTELQSTQPYKNSFLTIKNRKAKNRKKIINF